MGLDKLSKWQQFLVVAAAITGVHAMVATHFLKHLLAVSQGRAVAQNPMRETIAELIAGFPFATLGLTNDMFHELVYGIYALPLINGLFWGVLCGAFSLSMRRP